MLCEFIPEAGASLSERGAGAGLIQPGWVGSGSSGPVEMHGFPVCPDGPRASQGAHGAVPFCATPCCSEPPPHPSANSWELHKRFFPLPSPQRDPKTPAAPKRDGRARCLCPLPAALARVPFSCAKTDRGWSPELQSGSPARPHSTAVM